MRQRKALRGQRKSALISFVKGALTDGTIWEEYTRDDLAYYISERWGINYSKSNDVIIGTQFILDLEEELLQRRKQGTICECIPLLNPYLSPFNSLRELSKIPLVAYKATPYTIMGLASIITIRLIHNNDSDFSYRQGKGIPTAISKYLSWPTNGSKQQILHQNMRYKCRFCMDKFRPLMAQTLTRLLADITKHTDIYSTNKSHFVRIKRE